MAEMAMASYCRMQVGALKKSSKELVHRAGRASRQDRVSSAPAWERCTTLHATTTSFHGRRAMRQTLSCQLRLRKLLCPISPSQPSPRITLAQDQTALPVAYYRGGTARAVILQPQHLPTNHAQWQSIFRQVLAVGLGEPSARPLNRLTKGTSTLGNICLVEPYHRIGTGHERPTTPHLDYTLIRLDTKSGLVDISDNSGNMISAVGPYAYNARLLPPEIYQVKDGRVTVLIRNTNTMQLVEASFFVSGGQAAVIGRHAVDGVIEEGAPVSLAFQNPIGSVTGTTFPTGRLVDTIDGLKVTCVDGATPVVFVRADALGIQGTILPDELIEQTVKLNILEKLRRSAAVAMGIADKEQRVPRTTPKIALVSQSAHHTTLSGLTLKASQVDVVIRFISGSEPHPTVPLTAALTTAVAARMPGTLVEQLLAPEEAVCGAITIAHPSGRIHVKLEHEKSKGHRSRWVGHICTTARRLVVGNAYLTGSPVEAATALNADAGQTCRSLGLAFVRELRSSEPSKNLTERSCAEAVNTAELASPLNCKTGNGAQPPSAPARPHLQLPIQSTARDALHLIRELSSLRTSIAHFTSLYPPPKTLQARAEAPTPSSISHHLAVINQHINVLASSLTSMPRPRRNVRPSECKGAQWRQWAKTFSQWDKIRSLREAERKMSRRQRKKSEGDRYRDRELNLLDKKGRPVVRGRLRDIMLMDQESLTSKSATGRERKR